MERLNQSGSLTRHPGEAIDHSARLPFIRLLPMKVV